MLQSSMPSEACSSQGSLGLKFGCMWYDWSKGVMCMHTSMDNITLQMTYHHVSRDGAAKVLRLAVCRWVHNDVVAPLLSLLAEYTE